MTRRTAGLPSLLLLAALAVSGCSGSDGSDGAAPDDDATTSGSSDGPGATDTPSEGEATISPDLPRAPKVVDAEGAAGDLVWDAEKCGTDAGRQTVRGAVKNSTGKSADYLINISWINDRGDTLGRGLAVVDDVRPGRTVDFALTAKVADGADQCVPNVLRGVIKNQG